MTSSTRDTGSRSDAPIAELVSDLSAQTSRLVRDEMRLATAELKESAKHAGVGAGLIGASGLMAVFGVAALVTAAIAGLALVLPVWASALIVAVVLFVIAAVAALISKAQAKKVPPPLQVSTESVKKDIQEVKGSATS
ncbi:membrane protein [Mycolicibacterium arabiense]|uniref:Membrane protein n=1 Tax=Mycolicibacterium arabiense TaxID=1286181 RepID=A0A7I7S016_9MYCO|nr:phage holin family protein [Mycolicibacterium arabiense]MBJ7384084.1 phage holin family protein [Mycolicibacterium sp.]MCV7374357.1 phage holin family protein [Mycolicibacterium arabiense]BBY49616.1 membrane protein [Mycolicibacterium arabiense]